MKKQNCHTNHGQGALEYLLIIGGAIIVAALAIVIIFNASGTSTNSTQQEILNTLCAKFSQTECSQQGSDPDGTGNCQYTDCIWSANKCTGKTTQITQGCLGETGTAGTPCTQGQTQNCPNQNGVCLNSQETCTITGTWPGCDYSTIPGYQLPESNCNDGLDNDCDGQTDLEDSDCETTTVCSDLGGTCKSSCEQEETHNELGDSECLEQICCISSQQTCPDNVCNYPTENHTTCIQDCPTWCGDAIITNPNSEGQTEQCDGTNLNSQTCETLGFFGGNLFCLGNCSGFDESQCSSDINLSGVYTLGAEKHPSYYEELTNNPFLDGFSVREDWASMEPLEGTYDWSVFDEMVSAAESRGKKIMLRVLPGSRSPEWVYDSGAQYFSFIENNPNNPYYGQSLKMPLPWDNVYLEKWENFIAALGQRYANESTVKIVAVTGPAEGGEMYLADDANQPAWIAAGYTNEKLLNAWVQILDSYSAAFPNQKLSIAISKPVSFDHAAESTVVDGILDYGFQELGTRFGPQGNWLAAGTNPNWTYYVKVKSWGETTPVGFQMLSSSSSPRFGGALLEGIQKGLDANARYLEIYPADIVNPDNQIALQSAHEQLNQ